MRDGGLRPLFRKHLPGVHWVSIESGLTESGIPDANGCVEGIEFWMEYKVSHGWKVGLRPEQIGFHLRRHRAGGRTFVAIRRAPKREDELWLFPGSLIAEIAKRGLREAHPRYLFGQDGPVNWNWEAVMGFLNGNKIL